MMFGPVDYKANFESDVWLCFTAFGEGYVLVMYRTSFEWTIWCYPPNDKYPHVYYEPKVMDVLLENGLYQAKENETFIDAKTQYTYTDKGKQLYEELMDLPLDERERTFISRVKIDWSKT